jgi:cytochrome bd ubiquinol oxidase subunit I
VHVLAASSELLSARSQMAFTLGTHIVLASMGVAFPAMTLIANYRAVWKKDKDALLLAQRWSKVMAVLFAVGAVTGTVLSFEFGLLWPGLMQRYGGVFGVPFAIEGIFFFTEAIFISVYIYGWKRLSPKAHFWTGVPIVIAGIGGAFSIVTANSWMNQPGGFTTGPGGKVTSVQPLDVIFNNAWSYEVPHMLLAAYMVAGFLVASVYAVGMLRGRRDRYHKLGFVIPFTVAALVTPVQLFVGDTAARAIAKDQPIKFASMEYVKDTQTDAPEYIGGIYTNSGDVKLGVKIPGLDSFLVGFSTGTKVTGFDTVPSKDRPPAKTLLHLAFDAMVGIGTGLLLLGMWFGFVWWRKRDLPRTPWFLRLAALGGAGAIAALECGWIVTEVGRQPWIVYKHMRTADAVTTASGIPITFAAAVVLYTALGVTTVLVLRLMSRRWRTGETDEADVPYGPPPEAGG